MNTLILALYGHQNHIQFKEQIAGRWVGSVQTKFADTPTRPEGMGSKYDE